MLGSQAHCDEAEKLGTIDFKNEADLKAFNRNKKLVKKLGAFRPRVPRDSGSTSRRDRTRGGVAECSSQWKLIPEFVGQQPSFKNLKMLFR